MIGSDEVLPGDVASWGPATSASVLGPELESVRRTQASGVELHRASSGDVLTSHIAPCISYSYTAARSLRLTARTATCTAACALRSRQPEPEVCAGHIHRTHAERRSSGVFLAARRSPSPSLALTLELTLELTLAV